MQKISIITVCKNAENSIERTIKSVINQIYENIEYIVIDGQSTDGTIQIIEKYQDKITYFISEPDSGIYNAMNKSIQIASGDYLLFLNAGDCLFDSNTIKRIFIKAKDEELVFGDVLLLKKGKPFFIKKIPEKLTDFFLINDTLPHQGTFFSKRIFDKFDGYRELYKISADYDLILHSIKNGLSYKKVKGIISIVEFEGLNSNRTNIGLREAERREIQAQFYQNNTFLKILSMFHVFLIKYPRYFIGFIMACKLGKKIFNG